MASHMTGTRKIGTTITLKIKMNVWYISNKQYEDDWVYQQIKE